MEKEQIFCPVHGVEMIKKYWHLAGGYGYSCPIAGEWFLEGSLELDKLIKKQKTERR